MIIAIDGPAGAGKSSIAKGIAKELGIIYVDTGAMYRALTWKAITFNISLNDEKQLEELLLNSEIRLVPDGGNLKIFMDETDVTELIRQPEISANVSLVSSYKSIREIMVDKQRKIAESGNNIIMDGRDIGTVVFPDADLKIYLTASSTERAQRRFKEQMDKGMVTDLNQLVKDIEKRDELDMNREHSPLKPAFDSELIDTTDMSFTQVLEKIKNLIDSKKKISEPEKIYSFRHRY